MENKVLKDWQAFRRYTVKGVQISESKDSITFVAKEVSATGMAISIALGGIMGLPVFFAAIVISSSLEKTMGFGAALFIGFVVPITLLILFCVKLMSRRTALIVRPGQVIWKKRASGGHQLVIPVGEIRSIDVRRGDSYTGNTKHGSVSVQNYSVIIWHGPHPVQTISVSDREEHAVTLKEGVIAAIGLLNPRAAEPVAMPKRAFPE